MSIVPKHIVEKHCFIKCPPDRCNCKNGNPILWAMQNIKVEPNIVNGEIISIDLVDKDSY